MDSLVKVVRRKKARRAINRHCPITYERTCDLIHPFVVINECGRREVYDTTTLLQWFVVSHQLITPLSRKRLNSVELLRLHHRARSFQLRSDLQNAALQFYVTRTAMNEMIQTMAQQVWNQTHRRRLWSLFVTGLPRSQRNMHQDTDARLRHQHRFEIAVIRAMMCSKQLTTQILHKMTAYISNMRQRTQRRMMVPREVLERISQWVKCWPIESVYVSAWAQPSCLNEAIGDVVRDDETATMMLDFNALIWDQCTDRLEECYRASYRQK